MNFLMSNRRAKRIATLAAIAFGGLQLAGCVGGTTYGTDKSQEAQTLDSVYNLFSLAPPKQKRINYKARPDLVIPQDKQTLPAPLEGNAAAQHPDWPESPEQKRARLIAKADANQDTINQAITDDDGTPLIGIENRRMSSRDFRCRDKVCSEHDAAKQRKTREKVLAAKAQTEYSKVGAPRKYLTEPPSSYRTRSGYTPVDDYGLSDEEMKKRNEAEALKKRDMKGRGVGPQL